MAAAGYCAPTHQSRASQSTISYYSYGILTYDRILSYATEIVFQYEGGALAKMLLCDDLFFTIELIISGLIISKVAADINIASGTNKASGWLANWVRFSAGPPDFRKWESCWTMPLVGEFSRGSPVSATPSFRSHPILTSITLIGSQELAAPGPGVELELTNEWVTELRAIEDDQREKSKRWEGGGGIVCGAFTQRKAQDCLLLPLSLCNANTLAPPYLPSTTFQTQIRPHNMQSAGVKIYLDPKTGTGIWISSECSHIAKMNCEPKGLPFDLDDHGAVNLQHREMVAASADYAIEFLPLFKNAYWHERVVHTKSFSCDDDQLGSMVVACRRSALFITNSMLRINQWRSMQSFNKSLAAPPVPLAPRSPPASPALPAPAAPLSPPAPPHMIDCSVSVQYVRGMVIGLQYGGWVMSYKIVVAYKYGDHLTRQYSATKTVVAYKVGSLQSMVNVNVHRPCSSASQSLIPVTLPPSSRQAAVIEVSRIGRQEIFATLAFFAEQLKGSACATHSGQPHDAPATGERTIRSGLCGWSARWLRLVSDELGNLRLDSDGEGSKVFALVLPNVLEGSKMRLHLRTSDHYIYYIGDPGITFDAMLHMTGVELELLMSIYLVIAYVVNVIELVRGNAEVSKVLKNIGQEEIVSLQIQF
ncbi:hypothetical protein PR048_005248 [Dryococelus australis]|uniref:Uncharacterized protein n=1 Tax=Dryococelus australis TaxID=614101 RepID=A0ABQ9I7N1_9NEOP|nr:hypothetical protein PR048_005248 [Dryococelus australis]